MRFTSALFALLALFASPVFAADHLTPAPTMRLAGVHVFNPNGPGQTGGGAHAFGPVSASYTPPGVGVYQQMFYRTTPLLASGGTQFPAATNYGTAVTSGSSTSIQLSGISTANCALVVSGQQVIDATTGTLIGTASGCSGSAAPYTVNFIGTAAATLAASNSDSIVIQSTLPDACQGTFATRIRGSYAVGVYPTIENAIFFINGNGTGGPYTWENANGLWMALDPAFRFNWNNLSTVGSGSGCPGSQCTPYLNAATISSYGSDKWLNVVASWNSCYYAAGANPTYAVLYVAPVGASSWTRLSYTTGSSTRVANTSSPYQGLNHNAFSFGSDGTYSAYFSEGDFEDAVLDIGGTVGSAAQTQAIGLAVSNSSCVGYNDGNPCIPTATLNAYYNTATNTPVRLNSTGTCSDWLGHQPTACFTTDGGGAYAPSIANFGVTNYGYGGAFVASTYGATGSAVGPAIVPVTGPSANSVYEKWSVASISPTTGQTSFSPLASALGAHVVAAGDFIVATAVQSPSTGQAGKTVACGTGFTTIWSGVQPNAAATGNVIYAAVCYRVATGNSSDTSAALTFNDTATGFFYSVADYAGVDASNPIDALGVINQPAGTASQPLPSLLTSFANSLFVGVMFDGYKSLSIAPPPGIGMRGVLGWSGAIFDKALAAPGLFSPGNVTVSSALNYIGVSLALKPAGAVFAGSAHNTVVFAGQSGSFQVPSGGAAISAAGCWGGGASGVGHSSSLAGGGSGGGYSESDTLTATGNVVTYQAGNGGMATITENSALYAGGASWINVSGAAFGVAPTTTLQGCYATGAATSLTNAVGLAGNATGNQVGMLGSAHTYAGGTAGVGTSSGGGGGGGSGAGPTGAGVNGAAAVGTTSGNGGTGGGGGAGGNGGTAVNGVAGTAPGGGGGGSGYATSGAGGVGQIKTVW